MQDIRLLLVYMLYLVGDCFGYCHQPIGQPKLIFIVLLVVAFQYLADVAANISFK